MAEIDYNKVFGLDSQTEPSGSTGNTPADTGTDPSGSIQEPETQLAKEGDNVGADPGETTEGNTPAPAGKPEGESAMGDEPGHKKSDDNGDAEAYQKQVEQAAKAQAAKTIDDAIAALNLTNPYTKEPIRNKADYDAYREKVEADRRAKVLKKTGMSEEEFAKFVADQPEVKEQLEQAKAAREQAARAAVSEQMRQIHELDPSINNVEDLAKMPNYSTFYKLVKVNRLNFVQAYQLANMDKLTTRATAASRQAAINSAQSKSHLEPTKSHGKPVETVVVPPEVVQYYRALNPKITDAEMKADYGRYMAKGKKGV